MGKSGGKGISYFGLVAMGIGCRLGTSYAAFGSRGGFAVGWAGILMNTIVFCWVDLAAVSLLDELFPALGRTAVLYELGAFPVTLPNVAIQLALAGACCGCSSGGPTCARLWPGWPRWCC